MRVPAAIFAALLVGAVSGPDPVKAEEVVVHRGSQVSVEATGIVEAKEAGDVVVQRGRAVEKIAPAPARAKAAPRLQFIGGEDVWLLDRKRGRLIGCELRKTSSVGKNRVACSARSIKAVLR